ncbi:MAG: hypothetical protein K0R10_1741 [Alphaproteobacteria bacterium]|nr:hypothetical protein [Alphaproteobacteria bacterium]
MFSFPARRLIIGMLCAADTGFTARTSSAKIGPRNMDAPLFAASCAASEAPADVLLVSFGTISKLADPTSNSAICAAFSIDWPRSAFLPVRGRRIATLTFFGAITRPGRLGSRCAAALCCASSRRSPAVCQPRFGMALGSFDTTPVLPGMLPPVVPLATQPDRVRAKRAANKNWTGLNIFSIYSG